MGFTKFPLPTNRTVDFTSSGTWICPAGVYSAEFFVVGAGGGGGGTGVSGATMYAVAGGGGGGAVKTVNLSVTPGTSYTITIGAKGTGASNAVGGNGGFTEVLNGATVLVRAFGGQGGGGCVSGSATQPTLSRTVGGAGGQANSEQASAQIGGGGGGAVLGYNDTTVTNVLNAAEGARGRAATATVNQQYQTFGSGGINGYGAGGSGGAALASASAYNISGASYFAGVGNYQTATGLGNGTAAVANTGCGGGGGSSHTNAGSTSGGNGADGLVRINYFG